MDGDAAAAQAEQGAADGCGRVNLALLATTIRQLLRQHAHDAARTHFNLAHIFLPWRSRSSRSTQISYLVDVYRGEPADYDFIDYCLFVVFFPHLIAGARRAAPRDPAADSTMRRALSPRPASRGLTLFAFGLFTKTVLADSVAPYGATIFAAVDHGATPHLAAAWGGALAYTCQLYFDFSGYSTMRSGSGTSSTSACR